MGGHLVPDFFLGLKGVQQIFLHARLFCRGATESQGRLVEEGAVYVFQDVVAVAVEVPGRGLGGFLAGVQKLPVIAGEGGPHQDDLLDRFPVYGLQDALGHDERAVDEAEGVDRGGIGEEIGDFPGLGENRLQFFQQGFHPPGNPPRPRRPPSPSTGARFPGPGWLPPWE